MTAVPPQHRGVLCILPLLLLGRPSPAPPDPPSRERETDSRENMDGVPAIINISISLRIQPNEGPVFFKVDGTRFGQNRTIKLLTGSKYKIEVAMKPGTVEAT